MNPHLKQLWAAMRLPENFKKSYKFFCRGLDIRVPKYKKCYCNILKALSKKQTGKAYIQRRTFIVSFP